jgi:putative ABC transport system substrate-binding protein
MGQHMKRRDLIALIAGAVLQPRASAAQRKMLTIGVLVIGAPSSQKFWRTFQGAMRKLGYVEGRTVRFEYRSDDGQMSRLPGLAAELVRLRPDVIVTWFTPAATAAKLATSEIPIVMAAAGDPVATGLVASLARPGGNVTGTSGVAADLAGKCVEMIRDMLPAARRIAALVNAPDPFSKPFLDKIRLAGNATGITIALTPIHRSDELEGAFRTLAENRPAAVIVQPSLPIKRVADLALKYRVPSASPFRPFAEEGGLISYWFNEAAVYSRAAVFVDKILKGARPADLPVEEPTRFELVINMKTADALGLTIPPSFLARADEVIE